MNAQGASSPSHGGSAGTEGRGTDGEGRCTDHSVGSARHGSGRAGEAGRAKDAAKGSAEGLRCKKESMKKVPNGKSELELQELDPKQVRRILANRQSAAKSKERRAQVTGSLEAQISGMEAQREGLAAHCQGLRQDCERLEAFTQDMGSQAYGGTAGMAVPRQPAADATQGRCDGQRAALLLSSPPECAGLREPPEAQRLRPGAASDTSHTFLTRPSCGLGVLGACGMDIIMPVHVYTHHRPPSHRAGSHRLQHQLAQLTLHNRGLISELASTQALAALPRSVPNVRFTDSVQLPPMPTLLYPTPLDPHQASLCTAPPRKTPPTTTTLGHSAAVHAPGASAAATQSAAPHAVNTPIPGPGGSRAPAAFQAAQAAWDSRLQRQQTQLDGGRGGCAGAGAGSLLAPAAAGSDQGVGAHSSALDAAPERRIDLQGSQQSQAAQQQQQQQQQQLQQQQQQQQAQHQQHPQQQQCVLPGFTAYQGQQQQQQPQPQRFLPMQQAVSGQHSSDEQHTPPHPPARQPQLPPPDASPTTEDTTAGLPGGRLGPLSQPPDPALPLHLQLSQAHTLYITQLHAQQVQLELQQAQLSAQAEQLLLLTKAVAAATAAAAAVPAQTVVQFQSES
ncbi:MAG: hypothetical protein WDW38_004643 [Sanguina aurantia]